MPRKQLLEHVVGLRGIAILLVVLFHLMPSWCRCGHFGVDVFFVLSGYFMFASVWKENFSLGEYYKKKVIRILPPLLALVLLLYPFALFLYTPTYRQSYAETGVAALLGLSNEYLEFFTKGYFDFGSRENPLQHTWYLAITLQMYVLIPLAAVGLRRTPRWLERGVWAALFVVSIMAYHHGPAYPAHCPGVLRGILAPLTMAISLLPGELFHSYASPYYWSIARLWEVMAGAGIVLLPSVGNKYGRDALGLIGCLLIFLPALVLSSGCALNLPAVVGTMLVFRYGDTGITARLLTNCMAKGVGMISFSLYLCHWPVHALYHYYTEQPETAYSLAVTGGVSLLLAWIIWKFVEIRRFSFITVACAWTAAMLLCSTLAVSGGAEWRIPGVPKLVAVAGYHETRCYDEGPLLRDLPSDFLPRHSWYGGGMYKNSTWDNHDESKLLQMGSAETAPCFVMAGDSHANALFPAVSEEAARIGCAGVFLRSYMTPLPWRDWHADQGAEMNVTPEKMEAFACWLERHPEIKLVVLGQWWELRIRSYEGEHTGQKDARTLACDDFRAALAAFCKRMKDAGKQVAVITQVPVIPKPNFDICHYVNKQLLHKGEPDPRQLCVSRAEYSQYAGDVNRLLTELETQGLCTVLHQETSLLESGSLYAYENGELLMRDCSHLTYKGARKALQGMAPKLERLLRRAAAEK